MEGSVADRRINSGHKPGRGRAILRGLVMTILSLAILAGGFAGYRYLVATRPDLPMQAVRERPRAVEAITVTLGRVQPSLSLYGVLAASRTVDLRSLVPGEIVAVAPTLVDGGVVKRGDMLVDIDRFEFEGALIRASADLAEGEARLAETRARIRNERDGLRRAAEQAEIAARETGRFEGLARRDVASEAQLDQSRTRLSVATAARESRENQIRILEAQEARENAVLARLAWAVTKAERDLTLTRLIAPFDGVVSQVSAEAGRIVNTQDRVATVTDVGRLDVRFSLSDAAIGRLSAAGPLEGREIAVVWRGGAEVTEYTARIERIAPAVQAATGGFDVIARLTQPERGPLRPGAFVEVAKLDRPYENVASVPQSALAPGNIVFAIGPGERLARIDVTVAGYDGDRVLITGAILPGTRILTTRLADAGPGLLVEVRP